MYRIPQILLLLFLVSLLVLATNQAFSWTAVEVKSDPLVRMPGSQPSPENNANIEAPTRCTNCHGGYDQAVEPAYNWQGSMMAQAARDFLFYACMTTAAQDSIWAIGTPNAVDICERCHYPQGWAEGRSDPPNASAMKSSDFDGVHCDVCHSMYDPQFEATYQGSREGLGDAYWDETNQSGTPSALAADTTYAEDSRLATQINLFNNGAKDQPFFVNNQPPQNYVENGSGQFFFDDVKGKRASFADASARHDMFYSRYHKSRYFCASCHDVSNPVLANLNDNPALTDLTTELSPASSYFHVERTFSEFMLSDYGQDGGSAGIGPFAPDQFTTSKPGNVIATCQDCHMRDGTGKGASQRNAMVRPTDSVEHPNSGQPIHDMTGGNAWVSTVLASAVSGSPNYNAVNDSLLNQGSAVLTLDMNQGLGIDPAALLAGADRAMQQLQLAAAINELTYDDLTGTLSFQVQNQTGHKLISGFPEGRRMFLNIKAYSGGTLVEEINPYDDTAGTLKGLDALHYEYDGQGDVANPAALAAHERYDDALVYQMEPTSELTGETHTFHFALATGRHKDNRIPPKGFRIEEADARLCTPVFPDGGSYTAAEYAGGYDQVTVTLPVETDAVVVGLYYQTVSREYVEFLRDEINGDASTLTGTGAGGDPAYIAQTDPFFSQLKAWGNTIWDLWVYNRDVTTAAPFLMASASYGSTAGPAPECTEPGTPTGLTATTQKGKKIELNWQAGAPAPQLGGYNIYYDQSGKMSYVDSVDPSTTSYTDTGLSRNTTYCYVVTAWEDCDESGGFTPGTDIESDPTEVVCAPAN